MDHRLPPDFGVVGHAGHRQRASRVSSPTDGPAHVAKPQWFVVDLTKCLYRNITSLLITSGFWEFQPGFENEPVPFGQQLYMSILVPFPVESCLSGIGLNYQVCQAFSKIHHQSSFLCFAVLVVSSSVPHQLVSVRKHAAAFWRR